MPSIQPSIPPRPAPLDRRSAGQSPARPGARAGAPRHALRSTGAARTSDAGAGQADPPRLVQGPAPGVRKGEGDERIGRPGGRPPSGAPPPVSRMGGGEAGRERARKSGGQRFTDAGKPQRQPETGPPATVSVSGRKVLEPRPEALAERAVALRRARVRHLERRRSRGAAEHGVAVGGCRCGRGAVPDPDGKGCPGGVGISVSRARNRRAQTVRSQMIPSQALAAAMRALLEAIETDERWSGGLLSRETLSQGRARARRARPALAKERASA